MRAGTDIVKISRMEGLIKNGIPKKVFTDYETQYICSKANKLQTAAGIFAAKEAVLKALGTGITLPLYEVEVIHLANGMPKIHLSGKTAAYAGSGCSIDISISHDGEYAVASAVIIQDKIEQYYQNAVSKLSGTNVLTPDMICPLFTKREPRTHKGNYGRLFVLAGSKGLTGAAIMSCTSALKSGAGLITLGCANELNTIFETTLIEVMTKPFASKNGIICASESREILKQTQKSDVCLIGPGLGRNDDIRSIVRVLVTDTDTPCVVDADGLNAISLDMTILKERKCGLILTPHIGEFSCLTGIDTDRILCEPDKYGSEFAQKYSLTLVLKSHRTIVCTPQGHVYTNMLGNPGMATGGTGDVLAGILASFAVQGMELTDAAKAGVYIHSLAADMAVQETGEYSLTPTDIIRYLSYAIKYST